MARTTERRTAIIGAGICGLAHALVAARQGDRVEVFERRAGAIGASIRHDGMIWPIGQPPGPLLRRALHARTVWMELAHAAGFWLRPCGSLHLAYQQDEWSLLEEFASTSGRHGYRSQLVDPARIRELSPSARQSGLVGGLWSETELAIDPREAIPRLTSWLSARLSVAFHFRSPVRAVEATHLVTASGERHAFDRCVVAPGEDFDSLFPGLLAESDLARCKIQMMRTEAQPPGWRLGPHLTSGPALGRSPAFDACASAPAIRARFASDNGCLEAWGIRARVMQNSLGELVIGDSHHYGSGLDFDYRTDVEALVLRHVARMIDVSLPAIRQRWISVVAVRTGGPDVLLLDPMPNVRLVTGLGESGITIAFGLAEEVLRTDVAERLVGVGA